MKNIDVVKCGYCNKKFYIPRTYKGILYCPYCSNLISTEA